MTLKKKLKMRLSVSLFCPVRWSDTAEKWQAME
jgi:hypothetical protein